MRESIRTIDDRRVNHRDGGVLPRDDETTASDARLSKLINDYRRENERCTSKINELKQKLSEQHDNNNLAERASAFNEKINAKSFKVSSQYSVSGRGDIQSSASKRGSSATRQGQGHKAGGYNYYQHNLKKQGLTTDYEKRR